jgi:hypothetical protein
MGTLCKTFQNVLEASRRPWRTVPAGSLCGGRRTRWRTRAGPLKAMAGSLARSAAGAGRPVIRARSPSGVLGTFWDVFALSTPVRTVCVTVCGAGGGSRPLRSRPRMSCNFSSSRQAWQCATESVSGLYASLGDRRDRVRWAMSSGLVAGQRRQRRWAGEQAVVRRARRRPLRSRSDLAGAR